MTSVRESEAVKKSRVARFASETRSDASCADEAMLGHRRGGAARQMASSRRKTGRHGFFHSLSVPARGLRARALCLLVAALFLAGCERREPLTAKKAEELVHAWSFKREPVYAEVPQKVWWNAASPKDDYDEKALRTLRNLEKAGLVTVKEAVDAGTTSYVATATPQGFPILGTAPSARGPVYRGQICWKVYDGVRNFQRHPTEETTGSADLVWHYTEPSALYPLFETKINKPLEKPFATLIAFRYEENEWKFNVVVRKTEER
jgi:hypothetical protein